MKKKLFYLLGFVAINVFAITSLKSAPAEEPPDTFIQWVQCNCDTGEIERGDCRLGSCCTWGLEDPCTDHIPCDDPPPPNS